MVFVMWFMASMSFILLRALRAFANLAGRRWLGRRRWLVATAAFLLAPVAAFGGQSHGTPSGSVEASVAAATSTSSGSVGAAAADATPVAVPTDGGCLSSSRSPCNCNWAYHGAALDAAPVHCAALVGHWHGTHVGTVLLGGRIAAGATPLLELRSTPVAVPGGVEVGAGTPTPVAV